MVTEKPVLPALQIEGLELAHSHLYLSRKLRDSVIPEITENPELRIEHPDGLTLLAKPRHIIESLATYAWGVVYTTDRCVLLAWGEVPAATIEGFNNVDKGS